MKIVGLTGGIGSGKSVIAKAFRTLGVPVFDADITAKRAYDNPEIRLSVIQLLGSASYNAQSPDKTFIASVVFNNPERLRALNAIIHPFVRQEWLIWKEKQVAPYCIREAAILIESGTYSDCDEIIVVNAPREMRLQRVIMRDGTSEEAVLSRMKQQMGDEERLKYATHIIHNDGKSLVLPGILKLHVSFGGL